MTGVTHGADAERLMGVAADLTGSAHRTRDLASTGGMLLTVLSDVWQGADVEDFARSWGTASGAVEQAADHLHHAATELRRQAEEQSGVSQARSSGPGGSATQPEPRDDDDPDGEDAGRKIGVNADPTPRLTKVGGVQLPDGLDHTDDLVQELSQTPEGRALLQWLHDNGITVEQVTGATVYNSDSNTIHLGPDADVTSLIHEATHAQWDLAGDDVGITDSTRDDYVNNQLDSEAAASAAEVEYLIATDAGPAQQSSQGQTYYSYVEAYNDAIANGDSPEEARAAGTDAIRELYSDGTMLVGNEDGDVTYAEYYGNAWDEHN